MSVAPQKLPSEFVCPGCQTKLEIHSPITKVAVERGIHRGLLVVCGHCATFLRVGDSNLERVTKDQFMGLPTEMKRLLGLTKKHIEKQNAQEGN